jgi:hypothetical protein
VNRCLLRDKNIKITVFRDVTPSSLVGSRFLQNVGTYLPNYTASNPKSITAESSGYKHHVKTVKITDVSEEFATAFFRINP